jgi:trimeric autotransporter adhesin
MHTPLRAARPAGPRQFAASRPNRWWPRLVAALLLLLAGTPAAWAQLTGSKAIPGDYATLSAAITDLNTAGVGAGGVTFNVAAGYTETASGLLITTTTGSAANPIVFQKAGTGANPLITAGVGTGTQDAIIGLVGADYVSFNGIDVAENAANTTTAQQMEFGYALFRASATDGCQNVSISNATITLNKANTSTVGIWSANTTATSTTAVTASAATGATSNLKLNGNTVTNSFVGIYVTGNTATVANADTGNEIGTTAGNTLSNLGGANTNVYGIRADYQNGLKIENNTVTIPTGNTSTTVRGIGVGASSATGITGTLLINNNTVTVSSATSSSVWGINQAGSSALTSVSITNNKVQNCVLTSTGTVYYIQDASSASALTSTITGNQILGNSATTTSTVAGIYRSGTSGTANINNNVVGTTASGNTVTAAGGTFYGVQATTGTITFSGNSVVNNTFSSTGTAAATVYGYYNFGSPTSETLTGNTVTGLSIVGSSTGTGHILGGIYTNSTASAVKVISGNTVSNLTVGTAAGTAAGTVTGILQYLGTTLTINQNKIYGLTSYGAAGSVTGLLIGSGTTVTAANNLIGNLTAPAATGLTAISGVQVAGGTTANVYFNSIYLNASSTGATFGSSGIYLNSTSATLDARNNVVVNKSMAAGTGGYTAALRRVSGTAGTVPANLATTTNNNLYFAGTPSATNVIYVEGTTTATNALQTLAAYKGFAAPRETGSVTEDVAFLSTSGSDATFLHVNPATATQIESGGQAISGITTDFDGDTRGTTPDIGADEGTFTPQDLSGPAISYTALGTATSTANRTLDVTITDVSGIATGANAPRLYYRKAGSSTYAFVNATSVSGNVYTFTFDFAAIGGVAGLDVVQYYVAAQDNAPAQNLSTSPVGGAGINPPGTAFTGTPNQFSIQGTLSGTYYVGTGTSPVPARTYATLTAAAASYNNNLLGGAVTFVLLDAAYSTATGETFPVVFNANADASATNTLTIKPNTGVTASITGGGAAGAVLQFNGTDYVTVDGSNNGSASRNLTLTSTNTGSSAVVWVGSLGDAAGATNITLKNLNVVGGSVSSTTAFGIYAAGTTLSASGTGSDNDNLVVQNNAISAVYNGVYARGTTAGVLDGLQVTGNQIGGSTAATTVTLRGIDVVAAAAPVISQNRIVGMQTTGSISIAAIDLGATVANAVVSRNYISNLRSTSTSGYGAYGILISSTTGTTGNEISNNMISDIITDGDGTSTQFNAFGIRLAGGTGTKVYYNSVNLSGPLTNQTTVDLSAALVVTTASVTGLDLRNNVLANSITGGAGTKSYALYLTSAASVGTFNNNDYYVSGANGVLAYVAADKTTLADLRTATTQDAASISVVPGFVSATDLHSNSFDLNNAGTPVAVTVDYDGDARSATTPDLGADEFSLPVTADLTPVALVSPAAGSSCYSPTEALTVSIRNVGGGAADFATAPATVTVVVTPPSGTAQTFTATISTGTLASGAAQNVTLPGTLDMTAAGTYSFAVTASLQGNNSTSNDVLAPAPTRTVTAPAAGTLATSTTAICVSGTATLTLTGSTNGNIQLQQSTDNVTFTDISGATAATFTTPLLTQTTYFRARTSCNTNVATSNVVTVTVSNPQVTTTNSPVAVCEGSAATLTASSPAGTTLRYYDSATSSTVLGTGASFTTPALTASRQYFVAAVSGSTETVGRTAPAATSNTTASSYGLVFNAGSPFTLTSVEVYPTSTAGNLVVQVQDNTGTLIPGLTATVAIPAGNSTTPVAFTVPLGFNIPAGTGLRLIAVSSPSLVRETSGATYPYTSPSGNVSITSGYISGTSSTYYFFYNWQVSTECEGGRTALQVNVAPTPTATLPATATTCSTSAYPLTGTVGGSATGGTYTTSGTGTFSPNASTLNATYTPSAADAAAGTVTLTLTTTGQTTCATAATAQTVLTITTPGTAGFSYPSATTYCAGSTSTVTPTLATGATAGTFSSTTGLSINPTTGVITLATSAAGTYTVTNTLAASGACGVVTATATVTITPAASAAFTYASAAYCQGATNPAPTVTGTTGGTFASTTGLTLSASTGVIDLTASTPGTYTVTYTAGTSCTASSTATVTINAQPVRPTVTVAYGAPGTATLTSSSATGNQWYLGGQLIAGATGQTYVANGTAQPGAYTVVVTSAQGCASLASAPLTVTKTNQPLAGSSLRVFPNPTPDGKLTLELSGYRKAVDLTVLNAVGQVVARYQVPAGQTTQAVDLSALPRGVYVLRATTEGGTDTRRIVRE